MSIEGAGDGAMPSCAATIPTNAKIIEMKKKDILVELDLAIRVMINAEKMIEE